MTLARLAALAAAAALAATLLAGGGSAAVANRQLVAVAHGSSGWNIHDMFGLELVEIRSFTFKARLYSDGTVVGHWFFKDVEDGVQFRLGGSLHCAVVRGNRAWFGGVIDNGSDPSALGLEMWFQVADNAAAGTPDMSTLLGLGGPGTAQDYCNRAPDPRFPWLIERGDIDVRDLDG